MVVITTWVAFLIWVYVNPPGHAGFVQTAAIFALVFASVQASPKVMLLPFGTAIPAGIAVYVLVLPGLSRFSELAVLMFVYTFVSVYFFKGGARTVSMMGFLIVWGITNQQSYSFAVAANSYLMILLSISLAAATSYLIRAPRPEKQFLVLVRRFFDNAAALVESKDNGLRHRRGLRQRWHDAYHTRQLASLPAKLALWANRISPQRFPGNPPEATQALLNDFQNLSYRLEALAEEADTEQADTPVREVSDDLATWRAGVADALRRWSEDPAAPSEDLADRLRNALGEVDGKLRGIVNRAGDEKPDDHVYENFYRLLGSCHGLSDAAVAFAGSARGIDWAHWREERF